MSHWFWWDSRHRLESSSKVLNYKIPETNFKTIKIFLCCPFPSNLNLPCPNIHRLDNYKGCYTAGQFTDSLNPVFPNFGATTYMLTIVHVGKSQYHILNYIFQFLLPQPPWCDVYPSYCILKILKSLKNSLCLKSQLAIPNRCCWVHSHSCPGSQPHGEEGTSRAPESMETKIPAYPFHLNLKKPQVTQHRAHQEKLLGRAPCRSGLCSVDWVFPPAPRAEGMGSAGLQPPRRKPCPVLPAVCWRNEEPEASFFWALITKSL